MKILLVNPANKDKAIFGHHSVFPNSLLYIAVVLEQAGHEVLIYDNQVDRRDPEDFQEFNPDIVGFSVLTGPIIREALDQSAAFKRLNPKVKIVWGSAHPSVLPEQTIAEEVIDFVVVGAGEYTLRELVAELESPEPHLENISGLVWKRGRETVINRPRPFIDNLDELPDPAWHLIEVPKYWDKALNTSRGCPGKCTFCYSPLFHKDYIGELSAERIFAQMEILYQRYDIRFIRFFEDTFTGNRDRLRKFCRLMIERKLPVYWDCDSRIGLTDDDISLMSRAGCVSVGLGVETGSTRMLKFIKKGIGVETVVKTVARLVKHRIMPRLYFIAELPTETVDDFRQTQALIRRLGRPPYQYMPYMPFPCTELYNYCVKERLLKPPQNLKQWADMTNLSAMNSHYLEIPRDMIDGAFADLYNGYFLRPLWFSLKRMPLYFTRLKPTPPELWRGFRRFLKYWRSSP
ncbi:MAG: radical SAM protein [Dehalogenimonas sp.]|uniref:Radical SAM protein n=1 Tax=Candidatus Dehalogenimonas loeffleri TaxID=3127115 RepID=A0ABZ2J8J6_9CHLR|nr:radical SAM protein [Dehalogenimonas sp.]